MNLKQALRLSDTPCLALTGAGGKTTVLFQLARELPPPVFVTATTHLHVDQIKLADSHWSGERAEDFAGLENNLRGVMLVTGPVVGNRTTGLNDNLIYWLREVCNDHALPLLIEADGSRQHPLKAPAEHEPPIPNFVETVVVVAGLTGLGKPLTDKFVHRPEIFAQISGLTMGQIITPEALVRALTHRAGGLKNIPPRARRVALLNQADTQELQSRAKAMAEQLIPSFHTVIIASLDHQSITGERQSNIYAIHEPVAGIILAAGEASRFGQPKQLLDYRGKPFIRQVAETALAAGLAPVIVVTGSNAEDITSVLRDLPLTIQNNPSWQNGQSSSIQAGLHILPRETGATIFLLSDQPQVTPPVLRALVERHAADLAPIVAPLVAGQRANPVLFDRVTFPNLISLSGDVGGRAIFSKYPVAYVPWHDERLLMDVDTPEDYRRLTNGE